MNRMNKRVQSIEISGIRKFYNKVVEVPGALSLTIGEPDFPVPIEVKRAMIEAINKDITKYTPNMGLKELREELSCYLSNNDINYAWQEICITVGGSEGLFSVFAAILNEGDSVVIPSPAYPAYENIVHLLGGKVIDSKLNSDFSLNIEHLRKIIEEEKPKVLVISFPSNPTGAILSVEDKNELLNIVENNDIIVITDEMYSSLIFEDYNSIAQCKEIKDKVILVGGFSKMFSMTGLRIGYVCAVDKYMKEILKVHQYNVSCAPSIAQIGANEGLKSSMHHLEYVKNELINRRDFVYKRLEKMGFGLVMPKGAFYIFPNIESFGLGSEEFCERMLYEANVAAVPGTAFGKAGENHIRISYCYSLSNLKEAMDRIELWIKQL